MRSILVMAGCLLFSIFLFAQNDRGTITGEVKDQSGAVVPGATVIATNKGSGAESKTTTTETGNYTMLSKAGKSAAGNMAMMMEGQPSAWTTYISVEDADKTVDAASGAPPKLDAATRKTFADSAYPKLDAIYKTNEALRCVIFARSLAIRESLVANSYWGSFFGFAQPTYAPPGDGKECLG